MSEVRKEGRGLPPRSEVGLHQRPEGLHEARDDDGENEHVRGDVVEQHLPQHDDELADAPDAEQHEEEIAPGGERRDRLQRGHEPPPSLALLARAALVARALDQCDVREGREQQQRAAEQAAHVLEQSRAAHVPVGAAARLAHLAELDLELAEAEAEGEELRRGEHQTVDR